jgi:curli biogenesis system outer membrane secretion channel CsgG
MVSNRGERIIFERTEIMRNTICMLLLACAVNIFAANGVYTEKTESVTATGSGRSENAALYNALSSAVMQVNGTAIKSRTDIINIAGIDQSYFPGVINRSLTITGDITRQSVDRSFEGYIKSFEIVSSESKELSGSQQDGEDGFTGLYFEVTIEAEVYKYEHPLPDTTDKRTRIIVNEFEQAAGTADISARLESAINNKLSSTGKFNVLERTYLRDFASERNIMLSDDAALADKARLAMVFGSDLMISGTIRQLSIESAMRKDMSSKRNFDLYEAKAEVEYRLIIPPTMQMRFSDTVELELGPAQVNALWEKTTPADIELDMPAVEKALAQMIAQRIVDEVTSRTYPVLVAYIERDIIYLNEGGDRISEGDVFDIISLGEQIDDPQTGLSLGQSQSRVARVEVDVVAERMSFAKVIEGDAGAIEVGALCRKVQADGNGTDALTHRQTPTLKGKESVDDEFVANVEEHKANFTPARLAVLPLRFSGARSTYLGRTIGSREIAEKFDQYLTTTLSKTGKFEMLDRDFEEEYAREIQLILDSSPIDEILPKLDKVSGADYIVVGKMEQFNVTRDNKYVESASLTSSRYTAQLRISYRIIELATRKVAYSDQMDIILDDEQLKALIPDLATSADREIGESQIKYTLLSMAAGRTAEELINELFPILVVAADGDILAVGAGSDILMPGQEIYIYTRGREIKDPYTGSSIGTFDSETAIARVSRTEAAVSYAQVVTGRAKVGDLCKVSNEIDRIDTGLKKSDLRVTPSGGVRLPMDD